MNLFELLSKHFWIMGIIVTFANAITMKIRAKKNIERDPSLKPGYDAIFKGMITWGNMPWILMGAGILTGNVPNIWHFLRPKDGNPFVIVFFISIVTIWLLVTYWLFVKNGAEMLVKHPGIFRSDFSSPNMVKFFWVLILAGGIVGVIMTFTTDMPVPNFR
ncbi:MAG: hypothetical protein DRI57_15660 [Deltaproteobacteria bacterium]|nr:MAG: hypothetical protein DRI57_15660 [Deltaproteobacteria bacterium]